MEDDLNNETNTTEMPVPLKKVEVNVSEEPKLESDEDVNTKAVKVNGDTKIENSDASESSDYDNLVIDEKPLYNRKRKQIPLSPEGGFKGFKRIKSETEDEYEPPTNPYFNESLFELSELHNTKSLDKNSVREGSTEIEETRSNVAIISTAHLKKGKKKKVGSPKLREYAQYLGLQPTVQFKCSRCTLRGFASLALLNEHQLECTGEGPNTPPATTTTTTTAPSTNFRVTRKVYLCSACGTYYENWNLFLHMREIHKRFICLYCLGMFSQSEKLSLHLVTKHNCVPSQLNTEEDFFHVYKEPCYLMCCECEKVFSEQDNFFGHLCCNKTKTVNENKTKNNTNKNRQLLNTKQVNVQPKSKTFVEHVTGDTVEEQDVREDQPSPVIESTETEKTENPSEETDQVTTTDNLDTMETTNECGDVKVSQEEEEEELIADKVTDNEKKESESEVEEPPESPKYDMPSPQNPVDEESVPDDQVPESEHAEDTRKVPKVTLKLREMRQYLDKEESEDDNDDSDKLMMELDPVDDGNVIIDEKENKDPLVNSEPLINVAGSEVPIVELELEHPLDKFDIQILLQKCLRETIPVCVYCNHARKIAVNGKQLGLHAIAEHRFSAIVNSITAEELIPESFVMRIKESLAELQNVYFNLESVAPEEGLTFSHVYECFQCRYATTVHKELYLHNRKMHAKTILLCIMCKSNFYSYSELICHLCPGVYELNNDITFRCCMCVCDNLPSAFRLMVHLRKRHHACDVCLELCHNQSKLSNHVWKHKLHHLCYRCGIAYRNKPDITKHLFWKHGTESVLCKKCLQKKWPHIYHFCIPPSSFTCEECNLNFTKAVALKVHKRLHREENPHMCTFENCNEKFISKKLLLKHEFKHREPPEEVNKEVQSRDEMQETVVGANHSEQDQAAVAKDENSSEDPEKKTKPRVDVYDLPELNLSESDSDSEEEVPKSQNDTEEVIKENTGDENPKKNDTVVERVNEPSDTVLTDSVPVLDNIWDDFKLYQANKEKIDGVNEPEDELEKTETELPKSAAEEEPPVVEQHDIVNVVMMDHDYSLLSQEYKTEPKPEGVERSQSMDHDYCSSNNQTDQPQEELIQENIKPPISPPPTEKKERKPSSSSGSSNDSDSSSCTCGSNCSCSSSGSSSSSSDSSDSDSSSSEGRRKQQARRERRKQHAKNKKESETSAVDVVATDNQVPPPSEQHIEESDLDTTETETDEDFYDKQPQKLANKLIAEKRKELMLLAEMGTLTNGAVLESSRPSTPSLPETEALKMKKKSKSKKKKKKKRQGKPLPPLDISTNYQCQPPIVSPLTISLPKNSPFTTSPSHTTQFLTSNSNADEHTFGEAPHMSDASLRASKRRRIPNKFYGYSSDEEHDKHQPPVFKWRKVDLPSPARPTPNSPLVVPPITIKPLPPPPPPEELPSRLTNDLRMPQTGFVPQNFQAQPNNQDESGSESNESSSDDEQPQPPPLLNRPPNQPPLYCYCRCPYDEVSEMIGCDADDCLIEWFHFECVGIMVPPKGQWFCPDCRKKKQQRKDLALM